MKKKTLLDAAASLVIPSSHAVFKLAENIPDSRNENNNGSAMIANYLGSTFQIEHIKKWPCPVSMFICR